MSAFICNPLHVSTCAAIIAPGPTRMRVDTARELAATNVASVAYRYSPSGRASYASLIGDIVTALVAAGYEPRDIKCSLHSDFGIRDLLGDKSAAEHIAECCWTEPLKRHWQLEEAAKWLRCLRYQSCEHPEWEDSDANKWTEAKLAEIYEAVPPDEIERRLKGRHVWELRE